MCTNYAGYRTIDPSSPYERLVCKLNFPFSKTKKNHVSGEVLYFAGVFLSFFIYLYPLSIGSESGGWGVGNICTAYTWAYLCHLERLHVLFSPFSLAAPLPFVSAPHFLFMLSFFFISVVFFFLFLYRVGSGSGRILVSCVFLFLPFLYSWAFPPPTFFHISSSVEPEPESSGMEIGGCVLLL